MNFALITGASKGIGKEMALELAARKSQLLLVARSEQILKSLSEEIKSKFNVECYYLAADLSTASGIQKVVDCVITNKFQINILINNAGYGLWGKLVNQPFENTNDMMHLNMLTPVELTTKLIPTLLVSKQQSYILNVSSTAAYQAVPTLAVYAATKAFIVLFSRGLRMELKKSNISVTCLSPGATDTNFMNVAGMVSPEIVKRAAKFNMDAKVVARFAIDGMFKKKIEMIPGWVNKISVALTYFVPKALTEKIAGDLYKEKD